MMTYLWITPPFAIEEYGAKAAMLSALRRALPIIKNQAEFAHANSDPYIAEEIEALLKDAERAIAAARREA